MLVRVIIMMLLAGSVAVAPADACCHLFGMEENVGPCHAGWRGDLVFTAENRIDEAHAECTAGGRTVGVSYP